MSEPLMPPAEIVEMAEMAGLAGALAERRLGSSPLSESWLMRWSGGQAVVRRDRPGARRLGLDRRAEWAFLGSAHAAGLAPEPLHVDFERGLLVTRFVPGPAWSDRTLHEPGALERLGGGLRAVHDLEVDGAPFEPLDTARRYAACLAPAQADPLLAELASLAVDLYPAGGRRCLCHHDPHAGNLVGRQRLVFIDWEYAALGEPLFDLAAVAAYHRLRPDQCRRLLAAWSTGAGQADYQKLLLFRRFYSALARLWGLAVAA